MRSALDSKPGWILTYMLSHLCNGFLRFTSGVTPADLLTASIVAKIFYPLFQTLVGLELGIECAAQNNIWITFGWQQTSAFQGTYSMRMNRLKAACVEYCRLRITVDTIQVQRSALTVVCNLRSKKFNLNLF